MIGIDVLSFRRFRNHPKVNTPMNIEPSSIPAPESLSSVVGKLSLVWAGLFAGLSLGDLVLLATLVYTLLQIGITLYWRIIKPMRTAMKEKALAGVQVVDVSKEN